ncbi:hypothetical protein JOC76_006130 [Neobacillus cucumis]|nr:hypothetical protein [Neobacillus cucumis]
MSEYIFEEAKRFIENIGKTEGNKLGITATTEGKIRR